VLIRALVAFGLTLTLCPVVITGLRRRGVLDTPNARSSHDTPTPRGGGLAVAAGALVAVSLSPASAAWRTPLILASVGFGLLGLTDDLRPVAPFMRLGAQVAIAAASLPLLLRDMTGSTTWRLVFACGVVLWLVSYVNAFNFMDGINGISATHAIIAGVAWWAIGQIEQVAPLARGGAIIAAAAAGFLPFNFPRARIFLGDVGSYFIGAWLAVLVVIGLRAGIPAEAVLAPLTPYLADTFLTLVRRLRRGEALHEAHAEHVYQRLVKQGWSHSATTLYVSAVTVACGVVGATALASPLSPARLAAGLVIAGILLVYLVTPTITERHVAARTASG
jgi:UDP-GlcNAc:undecaprenyl-phosphate/decaprenyl-phosphate GlcNAc-1-phosphate transferase